MPSALLSKTYAAFGTQFCLSKCRAWREDCPKILFCSVPSRRRRRLQKRSQPARWKQCFSLSVFLSLSLSLSLGAAEWRRRRWTAAAPVSNFKILIDVRLPFLPSLSLSLSVSHNTELSKSHRSLEGWESCLKKTQATKQFFQCKKFKFQFDFFSSFPPKKGLDKRWMECSTVHSKNRFTRFPSLGFTYCAPLLF